MYVNTTPCIYAPSQENMETIASQVADEFNCSYCGVNVLHAENHCEDEDTNLSIVEITLGSRWILPEEMQVSVRFANFTFETVARADISGEKNVNIRHSMRVKFPPPTYNYRNTRGTGKL